MYSSTNNNISSRSTVYPFPPYNFPLSSSSSCYNNHPPLPHQEIVASGGIYGLPHNDRPFSLLNNTFMAPVGTESSMLNQVGDYQQMHYGYDPNVYHPHIISKQVKVPVMTVKKDRHSKIFTAQGLRDRRVRFSINVAREFFDLQDLLGFDKASKTVEWLLTKARKDIIDLGKSKNINTTSFSSSSTSECDEVEADINNKVSKEKRKRKEAAAAARELRSKARARARQRTNEKKYCSTTSKKSSPQIFTQLNLFNELEPADMNREPSSTLLSIYQAQERQSVAVKRKFKAPSASNYQDGNPAGLISGGRETFPDRCSHINIQFPNAISQNWDMNGSNFTCPSIYAITTNNPT